MSSVSSIRLSGLASGIDTDEMIKSMLTAEQNKIDKAQQKQQTITWQQEIYREVISDVKSLSDKYFSLTSPNSIISSKAWNTLSISSSNSNIITATGSAAANKIDYSFQVNKLAESAKASVKITGTDGKNTKLSDLGLDSKSEFSIRYGDGEKEVSKSIVIESSDTVETLIKKINDATSGEVKASYSEMTGKFTLESKTTGEKSKLQIVDSDGTTSSSSLDFLKLEDKDGKPTSNSFSGSNSEIIVKSRDGEEITLKQSSNNFTIDGITYNVYSTTKPGESVELISKEDTSNIVENMKNFVEVYNKIMDKVYDLVTQKTNKDYPPLTEAQKEDMSEEEIEKWEKRAKQGLLRNDSEMRRFMDNIQASIFGDKDRMALLNEMGLNSHENYNKKGQISIDKEKFIKSLENNSKKVFEVFAGSKDSVFESMKTTMNNYIGGSSSIFAKKAGLEKTASFTNNYYSEQLKKQADFIKTLQNKFSDKESALYKKFANLESSMNKLNNQMSYFAQ